MSAEGGPGVLAAYRIFLQTQRRSTETIRARVQLLDRLAAQVAPVPLLQLTAVDLCRWQSECLQHLAGKTVRCYTSHVHAFYGWAVLYELIGSDPSRRMVKPATPRRTPRPMSEQDIGRVFAYARGTRRLIYALAAFGGLRCAEIARLRSADVETYGPNPSILVHGKGDKERIVPLLPAVAAELPVGRAGYLIVTEAGRPFTPGRLSHHANDYLHEVLGIHRTLHSLRHWYATNVVRISRDLLLARDLLGHASVCTTEGYVSPATDDSGARLSGLNERAGQLLDSGTTSGGGAVLPDNVVMFPRRTTAAP